MKFKKGFGVVIQEEGPYKNINGTVINADRYYPYIEVRTINPRTGAVVDRLFPEDKLKHFLHDVFCIKGD